MNLEAHCIGWADCQLDTLKKCPSVKKVRTALKSLPRTLDETYECILLNTDEEYREVIVEALRLPCFTKKILTVEELAQAAIFSATMEAPCEGAPLDFSYEVEDFSQDPLDILAFLSGLVVCSFPKDTKLETDKWKSPVLLSHFSALPTFYHGLPKHLLPR